MSGSTLLWGSAIGDVQFPMTPESINSMDIGLDTPKAASFTGLVAAQAYGTNTATSGLTLTAANIFAGGSVENVLAMTGTLAAGANAQLPTVAALVAALPNAQVGQTYKLRIINESSADFAWTVTTNTGWTLAGSMSIAQDTWRDFIVTLTSLTAAKLQSVGTGTNS